VFPLSRWESGDRITYFHPERGHALDVVYNKHGQIMRYEPGPGLTDELVATLRERAEVAFAPDTGSEVRRDVLFSVPEVKGYWRHGDDWQILPAPPQAPRPGFLLGEHPFVLEYRVRSSANDAVVFTRRRRSWELHLLLSLVLRGSITHETDAKPHHWVLMGEPTAAGVHTAYVNEGYMVEGLIARADSFSNPEGLPELVVVPDEEYYARRGIDISEDALDAPAGLDAFLNRFEDADPRTREQLLRASYWLDAAYRVWDTSKSLSYIAAVNAVESLVPKREHDPCPCCGLDRSPGPTARFHDFVETYAAAEGAADRKAIYRLRSAFVHGDGLHNFDVPRVWGALVPGDMKHRELHDAAFAVASTAIRTWFLSAKRSPRCDSSPTGRPT